jgi:hypothetical protein
MVFSITFLPPAPLKVGKFVNVSELVPPAYRQAGFRGIPQSGRGLWDYLSYYILKLKFNNVVIFIKYTNKYY